MDTDELCKHQGGNCLLSSHGPSGKADRQHRHPCSHLLLISNPIARIASACIDIARVDVYNPASCAQTHKRRVHVKSRYKGTTLS